MLKNYLKIALRNLWRNKTFTVINIAGLAIGLAVFILIFEYVAFEWGFNRFNSNYNNMYRVAVATSDGNHNYLTEPGYAPVIKNKFPSIQTAVRVAENIGAGVISQAQQPGSAAVNEPFKEESISYVDGDFLSAFSFPLLHGTANLGQPQMVALSETTAKKIFGNSDATGKQVVISNQFGNTTYTVSAVFKDMPAQSDIRANVLLSLSTLETAANRNDNDWADPKTLDNGFVGLYLILKNAKDQKQVADQLTSFFKSSKPNAASDKIILQPFSELHLAPNFSYPLQTFGSLTLVVLLMSVALLILLIAWVNYINLSTVQALRRAKETGVRKVLGASRTQLSFQYLSETLLLTLASVGIAFILVNICQQFFNGFTGKPLDFSVLNQGWFWAIAVLCILGGSMLAGGYVSFVLSSYKPAAVIRDKNAKSGKGINLRKGLVVFQFSISIVFIIATMILYQQLNYMKTGNLGVKLDQLLVIKGPTISSDDQAEKNVAFKNALVQMPFVKKYAASNNIPGQGYNFSADGITSLNPQKGDEKKEYNIFICDNNFYDTYHVDFVQGKAYTQEEAYMGWKRAKKIIINEKAAAQLGFSRNENLAGKKIKWGQEYEIAGVVKDYHHLSLQKAIEPIIFLPSVSFVYFTVQMDVTNMTDKLATIKGLYRQYFPGNPFDYFFADEVYNKQYNSEQKLGNVFIASALVAIIIACLGLFGLAAFTAQQRVKEIGIRKVLGASVADITSLLSKDFVTLVIISAFIAFPIAWYAMYHWLQDFAYRITISWWVFAAAGFAALLIALLTVSFQAIKAALSNPVKNLRTE